MYNTLSKLAEKIRGEGNSFSIGSIVPSNEAPKVKITVDIAGQESQVFENVNDFVLFVGQEGRMQGTSLGNLGFLLAVIRELKESVLKTASQNMEKLFSNCGGKCRE
ncbi:hypothetical protein KL86SPO_50153 [uncultured Sporomusa sp.]|uniref:Uncharacterized protein n=1 Tax=uncultured Sporomusa sp. TaxID=307249 RepID=A0A212LXY2_9FIRM|nr:hypothetical protein [uncultured Sporomusa sp.]SCM82382.1 hypothetical protein KL86SPO_50153 [uncultured Sporomusa sp.]